MRTFDHGAIINTAFLHPNQVEVFIGDQNGIIRIWDLAANNTRDLLDDKESIGIRSLTISSDGSKLVAANSVGICFVWTSVNSEASELVRLTCRSSSRSRNWKRTRRSTS